MCLWWKKEPQGPTVSLDDQHVDKQTKIESIPVDAPAAPAGGLDVLGQAFPAQYTSKRKSTVKLVIHHVGHLTRDVSAKEIHKWHTDNGFGGIGYHFVIRKNGVIERGRGEDLIGAHCLNQNHDSIGICVVGDFNKQSEVPQAQLFSLKELVAMLCKKYPIKNIYGHRDLRATTCPGDAMYRQVKAIRV